LVAKKIRVGFCLHAMQVAGAEVLVSQIIRSLSERIEPHIFCLDSIGQLGQELQSQGIPVVVLHRTPGIDLSLAKRFAKELVTRKIEVVHAHQYTPFFYTALARMRGAGKTKVLVTEHGRHFPDLVSWKRRIINRWVLSRYADHVTACCRFSAEAMERLDGFRNVEVLYNGIQLDRHPSRLNAADRQGLRNRLGLVEDCKYVVCIARFHPVKDHETLVRAFREVVAVRPKTRLVLVGTGPEQATIQTLVKDMNIAESVEFWGVRRDISDILQACDVFSLTSVSEAASITLLEAMANGCPVAVTDVGGNGEHVTHGVHGLLSPRRDSKKLADNLKTLLDNLEDSTVMARSARMRVEQHFQLEHAIARYAELYNCLARGTKVTPAGVVSSE
jgi:glycosyltransferase involved in cell wall biosynthesis